MSIFQDLERFYTDLIQALTTDGGNGGVEVDEATIAAQDKRFLELLRHADVHKDPAFDGLVHSGIIDQRGFIDLEPASLRNFKIYADVKRHRYRELQRLYDQSLLAIDEIAQRANLTPSIAREARALYRHTWQKPYTRVHCFWAVSELIIIWACLLLSAKRHVGTRPFQPDLSLADHMALNECICMISAFEDSRQRKLQHPGSRTKPGQDLFAVHSLTDAYALRDSADGLHDPSTLDIRARWMSVNAHFEPPLRGRPTVFFSSSSNPAGPSYSFTSSFEQTSPLAPPSDPEPPQKGRKRTKNLDPSYKYAPPSPDADPSPATQPNKRRKTAHETATADDKTQSNQTNDTQFSSAVSGVLTVEKIKTRLAQLRTLVAEEEAVARAAAAVSSRPGRSTAAKSADAAAKPKKASKSEAAANKVVKTKKGTKKATIKKETEKAAPKKSTTKKESKKAAPKKQTVKKEPKEAATKGDLSLLTLHDPHASLNEEANAIPSIEIDEDTKVLSEVLTVDGLQRSFVREHCISPESGLVLKNSYARGHG